MNTPKETPRIDAEFETIMQHHTRKKGKGGQVVSWQCAFRDAKQIARQLERELNQSLTSNLELQREVEGLVKFVKSLPCRCEDVFNREDHFVYTHKCERCKTLDSAMKEQGK